LYHLNVPVPPEAVTFTVSPKLTFTVATETEGAAGEGVTVIGCVPVIVAPALVTATKPLVPAPANPVISVSLTTVKVVTAVPPIVTAETPENPEPVIVNEPDDSQTVSGEKLVIEGATVAHA
jgi:hypothetical protein